MEESLKIVKVVIPFLYLISWILYLRLFKNNTNKTGDYSSVFLKAAVGLHAIFTITGGLLLQRHPVANLFEFISFMNLTVIFIYLVLEHIHKNRHQGAFIILPVIILQLVATSGHLFTATPKELETVKFGIHSSLFAVGYGTLFLSFSYALMSLVFLNSLKKKNYGIMFENLPPLKDLSTMSFRTGAGGFGVITAAILTGIFYTVISNIQYTFNFRIAATLIIWIFYATFTIANILNNTTIKTRAVINVISFCVLIMLTALLHFYDSSWHRF